MAKLKRIDKPALSLLRVEVATALNAIGEDLGVQLRLGRASYDPDAGNATFKLEVALIQEDGTVRSPEVTAWNNYAPLRGLDPDALGRSFTHAGRSYKVTGYRPRARKRPVQVERDDGTTFVFDLEAIRRHFPAPKVEA